MLDRYGDITKFITDSDKLEVTHDKFVYISSEEDYDIAVDFERCFCSFEELKPFAALIVERLYELDNTVQRFHNKRHGFSPLRETNYYLNLISFAKPCFVTLDYVCTDVNSQFDVLFEYKNERFYLREFGLLKDIPDNWEET